MWVLILICFCSNSDVGELDGHARCVAEQLLQFGGGGGGGGGGGNRGISGLDKLKAGVLPCRIGLLVCGVCDVNTKFQYSY